MLEWIQKQGLVHTQGNSKRLNEKGDNMQFKNIDRVCEVALQIDGKVRYMPKACKPLDISEQMEEYWRNINEIKKRLDIKPEDNTATMMCKAYIIANGREQKAFKIMRDNGVKIWEKNTYYYDNFFLPVIFPHGEEEERKAIDAVQDKELLTLAQDLGYMRNKEY